MKMKNQVFILFVQSQAVGHAIPMEENDKIKTPLKNVFGLSRSDNQSFDIKALTWRGYTSGGMNLAEEQAGFEVVWANEFDADAAKTYRHNFGEEHLVEADIRSIDVRDIPNFDVLVAGFPCQPFSKMGKQRGFEDPRGPCSLRLFALQKKRNHRLFSWKTYQT